MTFELFEYGYFGANGKGIFLKYLSNLFDFSNSAGIGLFENF
jgi:hypothetical protein